MKKISVVVAVIVSALVIGCQENQFNPISSDSQSAGSFAKKTSSNPDGVFELKTQVKSVDNTYNLVGQIQYTLVPAENDSYAFSVVTDATLESIGIKNGTGTVYGESIDPVVITSKEAVTYERVYKISSLIDKELDLHIAFSLTVDQVQISNIWLSDALPKGGLVKR